jgi:hypothetical protein
MLASPTNPHSDKSSDFDTTEKTASFFDRPTLKKTVLIALAIFAGGLAARSWWGQEISPALNSADAPYLKDGDLNHPCRVLLNAARAMRIDHDRLLEFEETTSNCLLNHPQIAEETIKEIGASAKNPSIHKIFSKIYLDSGNCLQAFNTALGIPGQEPRDRQLGKIAVSPTCLKTDFEVARISGLFINDETIKDDALKILAEEFLAEGDCRSGIFASLRINSETKKLSLDEKIDSCLQGFKKI